ncbi:unnamed protein product, partial [Allacma fusca]
PVTKDTKGLLSTIEDVVMLLTL